MDLIKRLDEYFNKIEEAFNNPMEIKWVNVDLSSFGYFNIGEQEYRIECFKQLGNNYSYSFSYKKNNTWCYKASNLGVGNFSVLSTTIQGMDFILNKYNPNSIIFTSLDDSDSRRRLYKTYCDKFCKVNNYKLSNRDGDEMMLYLLFKPDLIEEELEEVYKSVQKIIELNK